MDNLVVTRETAILLGLVSIIGLAAQCASGQAAEAQRNAVPVGNTRALSVYEVPTPRLRVPYYRTVGKYPQVAGRGLDLTSVNRALLRVVLEEQKRYAVFARTEVASTPQPILSRYKGVFSTSVRFISASTTVVSALIAVRESLPGGNAFLTWVSATVHVPTGRRVGTDELFVDRAQGLHELADLVRRKARKNPCVRRSFSLPVGPEQYARGFAPTLKNYRHYVLIPDEHVTGFSEEQIASPVCGRVTVPTRYAELYPYLNPLGRALTAGVRHPVR
jgi:hypothetical protein